MPTKAHIRTDSQGNITMYLEGNLDYQSVSLFQERLNVLLRQNPSSSIITLDLYKLEFVGSSGIGFFIETIKNMSQRSSRIKINNIKSEFYKLFKVYGNNLLNIIDEKHGLVESSHLRGEKPFQN